MRELKINHMTESLNKEVLRLMKLLGLNKKANNQGSAPLKCDFVFILFLKFLCEAMHEIKK